MAGVFPGRHWSRRSPRNRASGPNHDRRRGERPVQTSLSCWRSPRRSHGHLEPRRQFAALMGRSMCLCIHLQAGRPDNRQQPICLVPPRASGRRGYRRKGPPGSKARALAAGPGLDRCGRDDARDCGTRSQSSRRRRLLGRNCWPGRGGRSLAQHLRCLELPESQIAERVQVARQHPHGDNLSQRSSRLRYRSRARTRFGEGWPACARHQRHEAPPLSRPLRRHATQWIDGWVHAT